MICCNNQCVRKDLDTSCGNCTVCGTGKKCTNVGNTTAPDYKCRCKASCECAWSSVKVSSAREFTFLGTKLFCTRGGGRMAGNNA